MMCHVQQRKYPVEPTKNFKTYLMFALMYRVYQYIVREKNTSVMEITVICDELSNALDKRYHECVEKPCSCLVGLVFLHNSFTN